MTQPIFRRVFALAALTALLTGCAGKSPDTAQVAGTWDGPAGATIILSADHHLTVKNVPARDLIAGDNTVLSGEGTWALGQAPGQYAFLKGVQWWDVKLALTANGYPKGLTTDLHYAMEDGRPVLFSWIDEDSGDRADFHRQP